MLCQDEWSQHHDQSVRAHGFHDEEEQEIVLGKDAVWQPGRALAAQGTFGTTRSQGQRD